MSFHTPEEPHPCLAPGDPNQTPKTWSSSAEGSLGVCSQSGFSPALVGTGSDPAILDFTLTEPQGP